MVVSNGLSGKGCWARAIGEVQVKVCLFLMFFILLVCLMAHVERRCLCVISKCPASGIPLKPPSEALQPRGSRFPVCLVEGVPSSLPTPLPRDVENGEIS